MRLAGRCGTGAPLRLVLLDWSGSGDGVNGPTQAKRGLEWGTGHLLQDNTAHDLPIGRGVFRGNKWNCNLAGCLRGPIIAAAWPFLRIAPAPASDPRTRGTPGRPRISVRAYPECAHADSGRRH